MVGPLSAQLLRSKRWCTWSYSEFPCSLYLCSVTDVVPRMQVSTTKYDSLIEYISIGLPTAIIQMEVLHVNWKLWFNRLQRRNKFNVRSGLWASTGHLVAIHWDRRSTLPQITSTPKASRGLFQPELPYNPIKTTATKTRHQEREPRTCKTGIPGEQK